MFNNLVEVFGKLESYMSKTVMLKFMSKKVLSILKVPLSVLGNFITT